MLSRHAQIKIKYASDQILAALLLVLLSPVYILIALIVKLDSRGPIFFCQSRAGLNGQLFTVFKFRTMVNNADRLLDEDGAASCNRITRVGKFLRRSSLDELPQAANILLGQMSFIGPRPGPEERHLRYTEWQQRRCEMKPGITGLAQVSGRNTLPWSRRVIIDIQYVDHYSWWLDLHIMIRTFWVVIIGEGIVLDRNPAQADDILHVLPEISTSQKDRSDELPFHRVEPSLIGHYRKDASYEHLLKTVNQLLAEQHDQEMHDVLESYSTIHVIGAPRSGTTLLTQLVSSTLDVGYVNNLIAAFWRVPCYGIQLSEKLLANVRPQSFHSDYGRTSAIEEPHEFGYFWTSLLGYPEMAEQDEEFASQIDWNRLRRILLNMTQAFDKPVLFKSFLLAWHLQQMQQVLPKSIFLWVRRDPIDNAISIAKARKAQLGSVEKWLSMKPREYSWLQHQPATMQIAGQVYFTELAIARQAKMLAGCNLLEINYSDLCTKPQTVLEQVLDLLTNNGQEVRQIQSSPGKFELSNHRSVGHPLYEEFKLAFNELEREHPNVADTIRRAA